MCTQVCLRVVRFRLRLVYLNVSSPQPLNSFFSLLMRQNYNFP